MSRPSCGGENHPRCTRAARAARASPVAPPRAAPSLSTERRPKRRRETRTTTGDETRVASREGLGRFMFEMRRGGALQSVTDVP